MNGEIGERWKRLCEQAAVEQDTELLKLMNEINRLLEEKEQRLNGIKPKSEGTSISSNVSFLEPQKGQKRRGMEENDDHEEASKEILDRTFPPS
jgi:hypothetical protein